MIAIKNARAVTADFILDGAVILVKDGKIAEIGRSGETCIPTDSDVIDAKGLYVGPGLVDIHVHGGDRYMFYDEPEKAAAHFLSHGETSVLATLYYDLSKEELLSSIDRIKKARREGAGRAIKGLYMEGPYMNPKYGASPEKINGAAR